MQQRIEQATQQVTSVALVATALLLAPAFAGLGPSIPLAVVALGLGGLAFAYRARLQEANAYDWLAPHVETLWVGPLVAALVLVAFLGATPDELKTVGSVVGLLGMANYLLRPIYFLVLELLLRLVDLGSGRRRGSR